MQTGNSRNAARWSTTLSAIGRSWCLATKLNRPELLDPVRQNLHALPYLLHADGEVVTEISRRQDQFTRGTINGYWFPLTYMALKDQDGQLI